MGYKVVDHYAEMYHTNKCTHVIKHNQIITYMEIFEGH